MEKVILTNPPWIYRDRLLQKRYGVRAGSRWPGSSRDRYFNYVPYPMFMGYAVSYLLSKGIDAIYYDAVAEHDTYKDFFKKIDFHKPDIVIQETATPSFETDLMIAKKLSKKYEVCLAGPHATAFAEELIKLPFISYILRGEYELSSYNMISIGRKGIYDPIKISDLDSMPYPYRDEKIVGLYSERCCTKKLDFPQMWIYASRGCAFQCNFCLWVHTLYDKKFILRQPERILAEAEEMVSKFNFKYILFDDDCWNIGGDERLTKIADGLHKIGVPWSVLARLDTCSKDIFRYLVSRGCVGLRLGVESLSQRVLDKTNKKLKVDKILSTLNYLKGLEVSLYLCFMHYIPGETSEGRKEHVNRIERLGIRYQNPPCIPFPGTPYYNELVKSDAMLDRVPWHEYDGSNLGPRLKKTVISYLSKIERDGI